MTIEGQYACDILVGSYNNDTAFIPVDAPHGKNIAANRVGAEHFLIINQFVLSFSWQQEGGHGPDCQFTMGLLEDSTHIYHGINIGFCWRIFQDRRLSGFSQETA